MDDKRKGKSIGASMAVNPFPMAVNTSTDATSGIDLSTNNDETQTLINSDILVNSNELTDKQRRVLLAAEAMVGHDDVSFRAIARNAAVSVSYVRIVLRKFIDRQSLPADCRFGELCSPLRTYEDLTETQRIIVNESIVNPDSTLAEISDVADCSNTHVNYTQKMYADIIKDKKAEICS